MILKSPVRVILELTDRCNHACVYCFNSCSPSQDVLRELNTIQWKEIIKKLADMEVFEISFTGGEPFIREDIFELLEYANKLGFDITINTNASLLDKNKIRKLKKIFGKKSNLVRIMVSLDTLDPETYRELSDSRTKLDIILKNIRLLIEFGFKVTITLILTSKTTEDYSHLLNFFLKSKLKYWNISGILPYGRGKQPGEFNASKEDWKKITKLLRDNENNIISHHKKVSVQTNIFEDTKKELVNTNEGCFKCPAGKTEISIGPKGELNPCIAFRGLKKQEIFIDKLTAYWKKDALMNNLRNRRADFLMSVCSLCNLKDACLGGCPGLALRYFNSINMPDPRCPLLPKVENISHNNNFTNFILNITKSNMKKYYSSWKDMDKEMKDGFLKSNVRTWLLKEKNQNMGYLMFEEKNKEIFIISLQIGKKFQHRGYGALMLKKLENYALEKKFKKIEFQVKKLNTNAIDFYEKENYEKIGGNKDYIFFEKILVPVQ